MYAKVVPAALQVTTICTVPVPPSVSMFTVLYWKDERQCCTSQYTTFLWLGQQFEIRSAQPTSGPQRSWAKIWADVSPFRALSHSSGKWVCDIKRFRFVFRALLSTRSTIFHDSMIHEIRKKIYRYFGDRIRWSSGAREREHIASHGVRWSDGNQVVVIREYEWIATYAACWNKRR